MACLSQPGTVIVVRVWLEGEEEPLRARLTWLDDDGLSRTIPAQGSAQTIASAVELLIEEGMATRR